MMDMLEPTRDPATPTLVLLHGAGGSAMVWPPELLSLPGVNVAALDLPGHGGAPRPGRRTVRQYATAVAETVSASGLSSLVLVGHSMGGAIALELAAAGLPGLRGLVLLGTSGRLRVGQPLFEALSDDFSAATTRISELSFGPGTPPALRQAAAEELRRCGSMTLTGDFLACNGFDRRAALPTLEMPTLVISGSADRMVPPRHSEATAAALPQGAFSLIEGVGHFVMQEAPALVGEQVAKFVSRVY
jgi:pimeloyl-ACP methyl ester carboxylesterase